MVGGQDREGRCPRCGEEEQTRDHIVFRCGNVRRVKDETGRRDWARENGLRWDSWHALASKKWVRMEDSGRVDDEGRPIQRSLRASTVRSKKQKSCTVFKAWEVLIWFGESGGGACF